VRGQPPRHPDDPKAELSELEGTITDALALKPGDRLVYPAQGVCVVVGPEIQEIAGQRLEMVRMKREEDGAAVLVPRGKVSMVGLRRVASAELMEGVFHYLAAQLDDPELNWKIRHRDNADRMVGGGVLGIAEVVKGLHALSRLRPLPTKERGQLDNARHLLVAEVAASLGVTPGLAEDLIDYALMPPAGTRFKLKPPPKPILMPSRPPRRRYVVDDEGDGLDDLGLDELGIEGLGEEAAVEGAVEGATEASGEATEGDAAEGEAGEMTEGGEAPLLAPDAPVSRAPLKLVPALAAAVKATVPAKAKAVPAPKPATTPKPAASTKMAAKPAAKPAPVKLVAKKSPAKAPAKPAAKKAAKKAPAKKPSAKKVVKGGGKKK
jgi:RNA polymerase-interacting CarD/CdnL/TRCF family regulator